MQLRFNLDTPSTGGALACVDSPAPMSGWVMPPTDDERIVSLDIFVEGQLVTRAQVRQRRSDVRDVFPHRRSALYSGWRAEVLLDHVVGREVAVAFVLRTDAGEYKLPETRMHVGRRVGEEPRRGRAFDLNEVLACAACGAANIRLDAETFVCHSCQAKYPVYRGAPMCSPSGDPAPTALLMTGATHPYSDRCVEIFEQCAGGLVLDFGAGNPALHTCRPNVLFHEAVYFPKADVICNTGRLPYRDGAFDAVVSQAVFEHVVHPWQTASELLRVLKPGGRIYIDTAFMQPFHGDPSHYFNMTISGLRTIFHQFQEVDAGVRFYQTVSHSLRMQFRTMLGHLEAGSWRTRIEQFLQTLDDDDLDKQLDEYAQEVLGAGVYFDGIKPTTANSPPPKRRPTVSLHTPPTSPATNRHGAAPAPRPSHSLRRFQHAVGSRLFETARRVVRRSPLLQQGVRRLRAQQAQPAAAAKTPLYLKTLPADRARAALARCPHRPLVTFVVPLADASPSRLERCLRSIQDQMHPQWQVLLVHDQPLPPALESLVQQTCAQDERVRCQTQGGGAVAAINAGIDAAAGQFVALLDSNDVLSSDALVWFLIHYNQQPSAVWFYGDEVSLGLDGVPYNPHFKPDFSPEYLLSKMFTGPFCFYSRQALRQAGGLREGFAGAADHDLALRVSEQVGRQQVVHIPRVLYQRQIVRAASSERQAKLAESGRQAVREAMARRGLHGTVASHPDCPTDYQIRLEPTSFPRVTVIIPTRNAAADVARCVESLRRHTKYPNYEVVIIDNQSDEPELHRYLQAEAAQGHLRVAPYPHAFNHSAMNNGVAEECHSEFVVFCNNDVEFETDGWLEQLVAAAQIDSSIAGVGTMLLYPDRRVQHGGIVFGIMGLAGHAHRNLAETDAGYFGRAHALQELSGATAALLLVRRSAFLAVQGFDAQRYPTSFNDVDLWLRLRKAGYRCLYNPLVRAVHYESKTRVVKVETDCNYAMNIVERTGPAIWRDPFYNPNLAVDNEQFAGYRHFSFDAEVSGGQEPVRAAG